MRIAVLLVWDFGGSGRDGSTGHHVSRMSFLTDVTPAIPRATCTAFPSVPYSGNAIWTP